jgi:Family of unknown function (DUF5677)
MIWAALLTHGLPRENYLACFRAVINHCAPWFAEDGPLRHLAERASEPGQLSFDAILDFDAIALVSDELFESFFAVLTTSANALEALRPLLLVSSPPGIARWHRALQGGPTEQDVSHLASAVARCLDHQSESSTDIRWLKVAIPIVAGRMRFGPGLEEHVLELLEFPSRGDLRSVRPSIRAMEVSMRRHPPSPWVTDFWEECVKRTPCIDPTDIRREIKRSPSSLDPQNVFDCRQALADRFFEVKSSERTDARLDGAFGLALYALSISTTLAATRSHETLLGRLAIRALVEARITLAFLASRDDSKLWSQWRVYGAGQIKLAFLKAQESTGDLPTFYNSEELQQLANEDMWQEHLDIDLGHWTKGNLRWMATEAGEKDLYDRYYAWSSTFVHAQWGAVRDTDYVTCHNPLHRLHRIPRALARRQASVEADAAQLLNGMLGLVDKMYPGREPLVRLSLAGGQGTAPMAGSPSHDPEEQDAGTAA